MSLPYMEFYVSDYQSATAHLTAEEDGIYLRLLILCWSTPGCSIPSDIKWISRKVRLPQNEEAVGLILEEFFTLKKSRFYQRKQMKIFCKSKERHLERKKSGKRGGVAKALKTNNKVPGKATLLLEQNPSKALATRTITITSKEKEIFKEKSFIEFYQKYPRHEAKGSARKAYKSALSKASHSEIMKGLSAAKFSPDKQFIPLPATWLNAERWEDESDKPTFELDWSDPATWHRVMKLKDGTVSKWALVYYKNNCPTGNFPDGVPPEILKEYWHKLMEDAA